MHDHDLTNARWRKSSYSSGDSSNECVEVADGVPDIVPVRDSKLAAGPVLLIGPAAWTRFIGAVGETSSRP
ncbi:DUF397 domain-containing protein [Streptomyces misionensis]|uniref:DUF397 domain-containing protein n=1 Tax=Streptomyces misionensis TaxID=67331 RepID=A0A5C6J497_9ACTN|nr:DUF397 domain-containing protein [Streptomyces misionensis]TWV35602.1 DUF397 domain-containing protein [Streptomyces misionensis]